jgi:hypothetical protein
MEALLVTVVAAAPAASESRSARALAHWHHHGSRSLAAASGYWTQSEGRVTGTRAVRASESRCRALRLTRKSVVGSA